jgi:hypothetical protein
MSALCASQGAARPPRQLAAEVCLLLKELGLPGEPTVELRIGQNDRAIRVQVHGRWQPFPPALLKRVWQAVIPPPLRAAADTMPPGAKRFPDAWLSRWLTEIGPSPGEKGSVALEFLRHLVLQIVKQRASCLVSAEIASEYAASAADPRAYSSSQWRPCSAPWRRSSNGARRPARNHSCWKRSAAGRGVGRSLEDTIELAFARLRKKRFEIHLHPEYARAIAPSLGHDEFTLADAPRLDPKLREMAQLLDSGVFYGLGVVLPQITWVQSPAIPSGLVAFRINDLLGAPLLGLQPGEWLVNAEPSSPAPATLRAATRHESRDGPRRRHSGRCRAV